MLSLYEDNYIGETSRCIHEQIKDHNGKDCKLHMLNHSIGKDHINVIQKNFKIIDYKGNHKGIMSDLLSFLLFI